MRENTGKHIIHTNHRWIIFKWGDDLPYLIIFLTVIVLQPLLVLCCEACFMVLYFES